MNHFYSHYPTIEYKTAALYVRCSHEEQAKFGDTIEAQITDLKEFAKQHHLKIYDIYKDEGLSARKKYTKRKEFVRMLQDVEARKFDYIIFTKLDRWFRNIQDFYKIQEILDNNNVTWLTALERYEMETTNGRLNVNIRLSVAQDEADRDSDRIKDVFRLKVSKGEAITGSLPIGYMIDENNHIAIDPDMVDMVRDMFDRFELTGSKRGTLLYLIKKYDRYLAYETISRALKNKLYKGEYRGNTNYCPAIIDPERFDRIQFLGKRNVKRRSTNRYYVFSGLLKCKECGRNLVANTCTDKRYHREYTSYRCNLYANSKMCTHNRAMSQNNIEEYLLDHIKPELKNYITAYGVEQKKAMQTYKSNDPSKIKAKLSRLKDLYINELIEIDDYKKEYDELQKELSQTTAAIAPIQKDLSAINTILEMDLQNVYGSLSPQEKHALWSGVIDYIEIDNDKNIEITFL